MDYLISFFEIAASVLAMAFLWMLLLYIAWKLVYFLYKKDISDNNLNIFRDDRNKH